MSDASLTPPPAPEEQSVRYAGFWIRVGAWFIDLLITSPLIVFSFFITESSTMLLVVCVGALYKPLFEGIFSATPGKMLLGLKLVNKDLQNIGFVSAIIRSVVLAAYVVPNTIYGMRALDGNVKALPPEEQLQFLKDNGMVLALTLLLMVGALISCVVVAFTARKQGLHDKLADTFAVYKESLPRH